MPCRLLALLGDGPFMTGVGLGSRYGSSPPRRRSVGHVWRFAGAANSSFFFFFAIFSSCFSFEAGAGRAYYPPPTCLYAVAGSLDISKVSS